MFSSIRKGRIWVKVVVVIVSFTFTVGMSTSFASEQFVAVKGAPYCQEPQQLSQAEIDQLMARDLNSNLGNIKAGDTICDCCGGTGRARDQMARHGIDTRGTTYQNANCSCCNGTGRDEMKDFGKAVESSSGGGSLLFVLVGLLAIGALILMLKSAKVE